jgi:hypothetical protein
MTRAEFLKMAAAVAAPLPAEGELIVAGVKAAFEKTLYPALRERAYPGHFSVTADGKSYGSENTWPGLDSWQMAGAFLLAARRRVVLDYFDFVEGSQRKDGNIPFAIFPGEQPPGGLKAHLRGMRYPEDVYSYKPKVRADQPEYSDMRERKWVGLFVHWQVKANPLSVLGPISHILTASEIAAAAPSEPWLGEKMPGIERTGRYLLSRISSNGLMSGAGFYTESPPRNQWDGITQCYAIYAFRQLAKLAGNLGRRGDAVEWERHAQRLSARFLDVFWKRDHFAEYVHPERGVVDSHGLSDVNWAAIGLGIAGDKQIKVLWPILMSEPAFWRGDMPTHSVTKPGSYEPWELSEPLPFPYTTPTQDVAAMGRVWYLESLACVRMREHRRLRDSVVKVCRMGERHNWWWHERYHAAEGNTVKPVGANGYCEYAAVLARTVMGNPVLFPEAKASVA